MKNTLLLKYISITAYLLICTTFILELSATTVPNGLLKKHLANITFEENCGQLHDAVYYHAKSAQAAYYFTQKGVRIQVENTEKEMGLVWDMNFKNANPNVKIIGKEFRANKTNYISPQRTYSNLSNFSEVWYENIYDQIDLRFYSKGDGTIEYDFIIKAGGCAEDITLQFAGIDDFYTDKNGELVLKTALGELKKSAPYTYQIIDNEEVKVNSFYKKEGNEVKFDLADYDNSQPLVIDPTTLLMSTYLGGLNLYPGLGSIEVTADGIYIIGKLQTAFNNKSLDYPTVPGAYIYSAVYTANTTQMGVISKLSLDGKELLFSTYFHGDDLEANYSLLDVEVDATGIYFVGFTTSLPTTPGVIQPTSPNDPYKNTGFVTKMTLDGSSLIYSTYLPGRGQTGVNVIKVINQKAYIAGGTNSDSFPTTTGAYNENSNGNSSFVAILNEDATAFDYATYIEKHEGATPSQNDIVRTSVQDIEVDAAGNIYALGITSYDNYPLTTDALQTVFDDMFKQAFLFKLSPQSNGTADLVFSTYVGGDSNTSWLDLELYNDNLYGILDNYKGVTDARWAPSANAYQPAHTTTDKNEFIFKFNKNSMELLESTYLNIENYRAYAIEVAEDCGDLYISGLDKDNAGPSQIDSYQPTNNGSDDFHLIRMNPDLTEIYSTTHLGGNAIDGGTTKSLSYHDGAMYIGGVTSSPDYPTTDGVYQDALIGTTNFAINAFSTLRAEAGTGLIICPQDNPTMPGVACGGDSNYSYAWSPTTGLSNPNIAQPILDANQLPIGETLYTLMINDGKGATDMDTVRVTVLPNGIVANAGDDRYLCAGDDAQLGGHYYDLASVTYSWSPSTDLSNPNIGNPMVTPSTSRTYTLTYTHCDGTQTSDQVFVGVDVDPADVIDVGTDPQPCIGGSMTLGTPALENFAYSWDPTDGMDDPTKAQPFIGFVFKEETYTLTMTNTCTGVEATQVLNMTLNADGANAGEDAISCPNTNFVIGNPPNPNYNSYQWAIVDGSVSGTITNATTANPTVNISTAGSHEITLTTTSAACGTSTDTMIVDIIDDTPIPNAGPDQDVCVNYPNNLSTYPPVQIGTPSDDAFTYVWSPTTGLDDPTLAEPTATISQTTTYTLTVTGICTGNQATDQITLTVPTTVPLAEAYEDDGINDGPDEITICEQPWGGDYIGMDGRVGVVYSWTPQTRLFEYMQDYEGLDAPSVIAKPYVNTTYYLTAQDTCSGKISVDTILVIVDGTLCTPPDPNDPASAPVADAGDEEVIICEGEDLQIGTPANPNPALTYEWFPTTDLDNPNIAEPTVQSPTNDRSYTLTVTNTNTGAKARDIITVRVRPAPLASAGTSPLTFDCGADISNVQLGPANGATQFENSDWDITWTPTIGLSDPNALRPVLNGPDVSNAYSVTVVDKITGCSSTAFMTIQFNDNFADAGDDKTICPGETVQIGTPEPPNTSSNFVFYQYNWTPSESLSAPNLARPDASPLETTLYTVNVTKLVYSSSFQFISSCQQSSSVTVNVTETTTEVADAGADHRGLCPTDADVTIGSNSNESPNATYSWSPSTGLSNATIPDPVVDISTLASGENTFTLTVTDVASGCTSTDDVVIEINATAPATASVDPTATGCEGEPVEITGVNYPADYLINWTSTDDPNLDFFGPADSDAPVAFVQNTAMTYTMNVTDQCGGSAATASVTVSAVSAPTINSMGTYSVICPGGPLALNGVNTSGGTSYSWEPADAVDNATIEQPNFIGTATTILKLTVDNGGCEVSDQIEIIVDVPEADAGADQVTCTGTAITIGTVGDPATYNYSWSIVSGPGPLPSTINTPQISVDPTATTEYQVSVVHKTTGCPAVTDNVIVTIPAGTPTANAGIDASKCPDDAAISIGSTAVDGVEYQWTPVDGLSNATKADPIACPDVTTIYTVRATNSCNGTFTEDQVTVTINAVPNADAGTDVDACEGESLVLGGTDEGHTYSWSPNLYLDNANIANPTLTVPDTKSNSTSVLTYTLSVDNGSGCIAMDQVKINTHPVPELNYTTAIVCQGSGGTVLGDANSISGYDGNYNILWSPKGGLSDPTIANPIANPKSDLIYTIRIYTEDGCFTSQEVEVQKEDYTPYPEASSSCEGGNGYVTVNKLDGASYSWTGPNGFTSTSRSNDLSNLTTNDFGTYTVTITSKNDCVYTQSTEMVNFCRASANCDIAIDNFTVSNCIYNDTAQKSEATIDVTVSWGAGAPTGERIRVTAGIDEVFIDAPNVSSPQTVQVTVPADGNSGGLAAEFESSTSCVVVETYTAPNPCNCTLAASVFADNCTDNGGNNFTARWNLNIEVNEIPDDQISYQRNSEAIQSYTITGNSGTIQIPNIPADGGAYDTLRVYLTNDVSCGDTIITKRPAPCPTPVTGANAAGEVCNNLNATSLGGTVWEDWNYNGVMDENTLIGVQGIQVNLYDDCNNIAQTTYTDNNGNYLFNDLSAGTPYRVEFDLPESVACWAKPTRAGTDNGTMIQFVETGNCANLGLAQPSDYCETNPYVALPCYENGAATGNTEPAMVSYQYLTEGVPAAYSDNYAPYATAENPRKDAQIQEIGTAYGVGWQRSQARAFTSSSIRRHAGLGPAGIGGIYVFDYSPTNSNGTLLGSIDLQGVNGIDLGTINRNEVAGDITNDYDLPQDRLRPSVDLDAFDKVGKASFGDADVYNDNELWLVNLNQRSLIKVDISSPDLTTIQNSAEQYLIDNLSGLPTCTSTPLPRPETVLLNMSSSIHQNYEDSNGRYWRSSVYSDGTDFNSDNSQTFANTNNGTGLGATADNFLYQRATRDDSLNIHIGRPNGTYDLVVHLATRNTDDQTLYDIEVEGVLEVNDFDLWDEAGAASYTAQTIVLQDIEVTDEQLNIQVRGINQSTGNPTNAYVRAIEIISTGVWTPPTITNNVLRPYALKFHKGRGYLGLMCTGENGKNMADVVAYVVSFDPSNINAGFQQEASLPMDYLRESNINSTTNAESFHHGANWYPWVNEWKETGYPNFNNITYSVTYPQPILADIEFADDGSLLLGFGDRWGSQTGYYNYPPISGFRYTGTRTYIPFFISTAGDLIKFCNINGTFELEGTAAGCPVNDIGVGTTYSSSTDGPSGNGEFFYGDAYYRYDPANPVTPYTSGHNEVLYGALAVLPGAGEVIANAFDPIQIDTFVSINLAQTQGIRTFNTTTGAYERGYVIVDRPVTGASNDNITNFGKGVGLGDMELLCAPAPLEIGNYVWEDLDADGIQDACEPPMEGIFIVLYKKINGFTAFVDSTRTDANGHYYFKELDGNRDTLQTGVEYTISVGQLAQYKPETERLTYNGKLYALTDPNVGDNVNIDSDGIPYPEIVSTFTDYPSATFTIDDPGCIDHSIDFGFYPTCELAVNFTQTCNDNNTGGDTNDDYIVFSFDVSNTYAGASNQYQVIYDGNVIAEVNYGSIATIEYTTTAMTTRFLADNASTYTFTIQDKDDSTCLEELTSTPVDHCSSCPTQICLPVMTTKKLGGGTN